VISLEKSLEPNLTSQSQAQVIEKPYSESQDVQDNQLKQFKNVTASDEQIVSKKIVETKSIPK
jgi:hypothetical protein